MYTRNKCDKCGYVMVGSISEGKTVYFCPKPGHTVREEIKNESLNDYDVAEFTYQDIKRSLLL